jgi:hypothetical protein
VASAGAPRAEGTRSHDLTGSGATDCSIAAQIKELTGIPLAQVVSDLPRPAPAPGAGPAPTPTTTETATETPGLE